MSISISDTLEALDYENDTRRGLQLPIKAEVFP